MACRKTRQELQHCQCLCPQPPPTKSRNPFPDCGDIGSRSERVNHLCKKYGFLKFASKDGVCVKMTSEKVENIKENTMTTLTHDLTRHLRALRQTLSQDKKPIGFFISAGCPLSVPMPEGEWPLIPDMKQLSEYVSSKLSKLPNEQTAFDRLIKELESADKDKNNLEDVLSFVRSLKSVACGGGEVRGLKEQELIELEISICKHIIEKVRRDLPNKETPYHRFAKWISAIDRDRPVEIFTTNYDLLMEQALEELSIPYFDGFVGSRQSFFDLRSIEDNLMPKHWSRLWKIHGSINWYQKANKEVFRSDMFKDDTDTSFLIYPSHLKYDQSRKMPFLALSDQLSRFLRHPSAALILCGYSFNDEHINDTIVNALKSNPTAIVIALMYGNIKTNTGGESYPRGVEIAQKRHNMSFWTKDEAIIGTNRGKWSKISDSSDDVLHFIKEDGSTSNIYTEIGDFKVFSEFLSSLIGYSGEEEDGK